MRINLSSFAVKNPIPTFVLFFILTVWGIYSFIKLPVNAEPAMNFPAVCVSVTLDGASPTELENSVTRKIEDAIAGMSGVRHISSTITEGNSSTTVEFQLETDVQDAVNEVRNVISQIKDTLPSNISSPVIDKLDNEGGALGYYVVESLNMDANELSWFIDDNIIRSLLAVKGVKQVKRLGGTKREIRVELDAGKLNALGITVSKVSSELARRNVSIPAGKAVIFGEDQAVRVLSSKDSIENLSEFPLAVGNRIVKLREIASIKDASEPATSITRLNGREVIAFQLFRARGASDTVVEQNVSKALEEIMRKNSQIRITEIYNSVNATNENYEIAVSTLVEGALLTIVVVFMFLGNIRATLIAAIALPLSILPAFALMDLMGYTLNSITLLAITLVVGILVDDAIVEIENIGAHLAKGKSPYNASLDGATTIGVAVIAITACIVAVFLPVSFIDGITGQYFNQFGITVAAAVISSLLVARMVTPLLAAYILKPLPSIKDDRQKKLKAIYIRLLDYALSHRKVTFATGVTFLLISFIMIPLLPTGFVPKGDTGISQINVTLPPGYTLKQNDLRLLDLYRAVSSFDEVQNVFVTSGAGQLNKAEILIKLKDYNNRSCSQKKFEDKLRKELLKYEDLKFAFRNEMSERDVTILLTGNNPEKLIEYAKLLKSQMQQLPVLENVQINAPLSKKEIQVILRDFECARYGISATDIGNELKQATVGDTESNSAHFNLKERQIPIIVTLSELDKNSLNALKNLWVEGSKGNLVKIGAISDIGFGEGDSIIERYDRERRISVEADLSNGQTIGTAISEVYALPLFDNLPQEIRSPDYGDGEYMTEMFNGFAFSIAFGVMTVIMILAVLFNNLLQPFTILLSMPLSIGGAVAGLYLHGAALDMSSVIGMLMLIGIVSKNSILLIDYVIEKMSHGMDRKSALLLAGSERVRPIVMTTIAMVCGMLPAVFASGPAAAFRAPMALSVICGLLSSTLLSLVFVPVFFSLMDDLQKRLILLFKSILS